MAVYKDVENFKKLFDEQYKETRKLIEDGEMHLDNLAEGFHEADRVIQKMPTADVVELKHGRWRRRAKYGEVYCSECGTLERYTDGNFKSRYCPNCGAKMDGKGKDDDMLPTEIFVDCYDIDTEWYELEEQEQEEVLSDYLSDTYGFCHYGFCYEESNGKIHITDIEWDEDE